MRGIRAVCAISVVALAACSSPAEPETLPAVTTEPTPVERPTPSLSVESPLAVPGEAIDFVDEYVSLTNLALSEPSAMDEWEQQFAPSCAVCVSGFQTASAIHARGQTISGGEWQRWTVSLSDDMNDDMLVLVSGSIGEATVVDGSGQIVDEFAAVDSISVAYTVRRQPDGTWRIVAGDVVS